MRGLGNAGFTLLETVVATATFAVVTLAILGLQALAERQNRHLENLAMIHAPKKFLQHAFRDQDVCNCNLNVPAGRNLSINTVAPNVPDLNLQFVRSSCEWTSSKNIIAQENELLAASPTLSAGRVRLRNIIPTGEPNQYTGVIDIEVKPNDGTEFRPLRKVVLFETDPTAGTPNARPIKSCVVPKTASPTGPMTCPNSSFDLLGTPGTSEVLCVEKATRPATTWAQAMINCHNLEFPGFARGRMCYAWEMGRICEHANLTNRDTREFYLSVGNSFNTVGACVPNWGAETWQTNKSAFFTTMGTYRCCIE